MAKKRIQLFITSSPFIEGQCEITQANRMAENLRKAVKPNAKALFIPTNPDDRGNTAGITIAYRQAMERQGMTFSRFAYLDHSNMDAAERLVGTSDFIVLGGGSLPMLDRFLTELDICYLLRDFEGVIMGISAGAMILPEEAYITPEEPGEGADPNFQRFVPGIGYTRRQIVPHYYGYRNNYVDGLRLFEDIIFPDSCGYNCYDGQKRLFYILPDNSYIYNDGSNEYLYGEGWACTNGKMYRINDNDSVIRL